MSWHDAPLYVESHDLARWVVERVDSWPPPAPLAGPVIAASTDLLTSVALALTFVDGRADHLHRADEAIVRLRVLLRVARDAGSLSPGGVRFAAGRLREIGRMVGGWKRRLDDGTASSDGTDFEGKDHPA